MTILIIRRCTRNIPCCPFCCVVVCPSCYPFFHHYEWRNPSGTLGASDKQCFLVQSQLSQRAFVISGRRDMVSFSLQGAPGSLNDVGPQHVFSRHHCAPLYLCSVISSSPYLHILGWAGMTWQEHVSSSPTGALWALHQRSNRVGHEGEIKISRFLTETFDCLYSLPIALWEMGAECHMV